MSLLLFSGAWVTYRQCRQPEFWPRILTLDSWAFISMYVLIVVGVKNRITQKPQLKMLMNARFVPMSICRTGRTGWLMVVKLMFKQGNAFLTLCDKHADHRAVQTRKWMFSATFPRSNISKWSSRIGRSLSFWNQSHSFVNAPPLSIQRQGAIMTHPALMRCNSDLQREQGQRNIGLNQGFE